MNNKLENFVKENRKAFDVMEPSAALWSKIELTLNTKQETTKKIKKKSSNLFLWLSSAAAILLVFGLGYIYLSKRFQKESTLADVNQVYARKDVQYASLITEKKDSLAIFASVNPELYRKFTSDLALLDDEYNRLKLELSGSANPSFIIAAMIKNREAQLQVLKQQLQIILQVNDYKKVNQI